MKNKATLFIIAICIISIIVALYFFVFPKKEIHYHAGFKVFVEGKQQIFIDFKYMSLIPCGKSDNKNDQLEKAHLHDMVGDVIHVHRGNALWEDLFKNIHFPIDKTKPIEGYINGKKVPNILKEKIKPYDSVIILIGKHGKVADYLKQAVTKQRILTVEKKSESCGK